MPRRNGLLRQVSVRAAPREPDNPLQRDADLQAMHTASDLFAGAHDAPSLLHNAAVALAAEPGAMCLVSLADREVLRPYTVAHHQRDATHQLRRIMAGACAGARADAFSRTVHRSGGSLRMDVASSNVLRLWLPDVYWGYVERTRVRGVLAAALARQGQVLGTLMLWREHGQPAYCAADQAYVSALAGRLAHGIAATQAPGPA